MNLGVNFTTTGGIAKGVSVEFFNDLQKEMYRDVNPGELVDRLSIAMPGGVQVIDISGDMPVRETRRGHQASFVALVVCTNRDFQVVWSIKKVTTGTQGKSFYPVSADGYDMKALKSVSVQEVMTRGNLADRINNIRSLINSTLQTL